jgi:hypothetical protein
VEVAHPAEADDTDTDLGVDHLETPRFSPVGSVSSSKTTNFAVVCVRSRFISKRGQRPR